MYKYGVKSGIHSKNNRVRVPRSKYKHSYQTFHHWYSTWQLGEKRVSFSPKLVWYITHTVRNIIISTPSVRKCLSSKWIKGDVAEILVIKMDKKKDVSRIKIHLDTSLFIYFKSEFHFLPHICTFVTLITPSSENSSRIPLLKALDSRFLMRVHQVRCEVMLRIQKYVDGHKEWNR